MGVIGDEVQFRVMPCRHKRRRCRLRALDREDVIALAEIEARRGCLGRGAILVRGAMAAMRGAVMSCAAQVLPGASGAISTTERVRPIRCHMSSIDSPSRLAPCNSTTTGAAASPGGTRACQDRPSL